MDIKVSCVKLTICPDYPPITNTQCTYTFSLEDLHIEFIENLADASHANNKT